MKAQELRVGNWIQREDLFDGSSREDQIIFLGEKATVTGPIKVIARYEDLKGIPLTEDWLRRFGFDAELKTSHSTGLPVDFAVYRKGPLTYNQIQEMWWLNGKFERGIKYVHQLQNLYHALMGEEL